MNSFLRFARGRWSRLSIRSKMILLYTLAVLLPTCLLMFAYYQKSSAVMQGEVQQSVLQTLKQAELHVSYRLNNVANVSSVLTSNPLIYEYLTRYQTRSNRYQQYLDYKELEKYLDSLENTPNLFRIRFYVDPQLLYARERVRYFSLEELERTTWYDRALQDRGSLYWMDTYLPNADEPPMVSAIRVLRDPEQFDRVIGVLVVDMKEEELSSVLADIDLGRNERIALINADGKVISSPDKSRLGENLLESVGLDRKSLEQEGFAGFRTKAKSYSLLYQTVAPTGWKLVAEVPEVAFTGKSIALNRISIAVAIVATLVIFILIMFLLFASAAEGMSARIRKLIRVMKQEGLEHLDGTIALGSGSGDISTLEHSIGRMVQTVRSLAEDSFQAKLQEREAMLKALQAQINPHFLYNTLEAINWMAIRRDAEDISLMVDSLSKYFRLTLNKGRDIVTVREEVALVKAYLDIQQTRFQGSFETIYSIEADVEALMIPKLTLQPIVENALLHGLRSRTQKDGLISVRIRAEGEGDRRYVAILIEDNGAGIPAAKLERLFEKRDAELSYGLYNVNERLRLFSGEGGGMHVESEEGVGTRVMIRLKAIAAAASTAS